jgi:hypothetical protein
MTSTLGLLKVEKKVRKFYKNEKKKKKAVRPCDLR